jgi:hypothetical protein
MNTQRRAETEAVAPDEPNRGSGSFGSPWSQDSEQRVAG